jgi:hypothetical protein
LRFLANQYLTAFAIVKFANDNKMFQFKVSTIANGFHGVWGLGDL